jgi:oxygen-independent coproporphyrinogen-3 oxidase
VTPLGVYLHVPFCAARCGYCDFNTYVGRSTAGFVEAIDAELALAAPRVAGRRVATVFVGGGTPTLLAPAELGALLAAVDRHLGLEPGAEVTVEANPESVDRAALAALRAAGVTRVSLGMQSAAPGVLATLERRHSPGRAVAAAREARAAGFEHVSLDLIYGTPGETDADWRASLEAALSAGVDHISAYALSVQPGTRMAARVRRGELPAPDDDVQARRYEAADALLDREGLGWYELSNWAATPAARCRHNLGYWRSADWWGAGPGAHSHLDGERWSNLLRPEAWAGRVMAGEDPAAEREVLTAAERRVERVLLGVRLAEGLALQAGERAAAARLAGDGLVRREPLEEGRAVLTLEGRLRADTVARALL